MKLTLLFETKPYSEMSPKQAAQSRRMRAQRYQNRRKKLGRAASGSNETNKRTTAKWRSENPDKAAQVNKVNYRVKRGKLPHVKPGKQRHHRSYSGKEGGKFLSVNASTNAKRANQKRTQNNATRKSNFASQDS